MSNIKHIVIDARIRPSSTGRYTDRLLEHLQQIDRENRYTVLLEPGDKWKPTAQNFSVQVCEFRRFSFNLLDQLFYALQLYRLKADLVHFSMTPLEPIFYFGKRVTTTHDLTMLRFARAGKLPGWLHAIRMLGYNFLFWWSLKLARHIIVPTKFVKGDVAQSYRFAKKKITVTYEASEPPLAIDSEMPRGLMEPYIMHVGSPFPHKNIERLVMAFEVCRQTNPKLQLVLVGKKEYYFEKLEKWVGESPVRDSIHITGFVSEAELKWLYQHAEAYVLPSLSEGFGLPGLEAMAHGCPLVSSNATCLPEVYGDGAHYFDPNNLEDIAAKTGEVIKDRDLRKKLIHNGYVQLKKYSWRHMAEQTLDVYRSALK
jgi:glycosyltransferase involved in cell wall biosynthesis